LRIQAGQLQAAPCEEERDASEREADKIIPGYCDQRRQELMDAVAKNRKPGW
jgi:hypothetical protein